MSGERDTTGERGRRWLIRVVVAVVFVAGAWYAFLGTEVPVGPDGRPSLPVTALGQPFVYRLQLLLLVVFGGLLLLTPLVQGVVNGRLPTEISARGAKFDPEDVSAGLKELEDRIGQVEATVATDAGTLLGVQAEVEALKAERPVEGPPARRSGRFRPGREGA